jgi:hypothetical protein
MQPASSEGNGSDTGRLLRRYGPIGLIAAVVVVIVVVIVASSGGSDDDAEPASSSVTEVAEPAVTEPVDSGPSDTGATDGGTDDAGADDTTATETASSDDVPDASEPAETDGGTDGAADTGLPEGVMSFSVAQELGLDVDFGPRCDPETGNVAVPSFFAPECYAPFEGDNGGATAQGVTEDTIRIAWWISQDQDPILAYITSAILNDDTNADDEATVRAMLEYYETYYETYGRSVELVVVEASGNIADEAAARADAVKIAEDVQPFMVWGAPTLTSAFAEELAARGIPCMSCGPSQDSLF